MTNNGIARRGDARPLLQVGVVAVEERVDLRERGDRAAQRAFRRAFRRELEQRQAREQ